MKWSWVLVMFCWSKGFSQFYFYDDRYYDQPFILEAGVQGGLINCLTDLGKSAVSRQLLGAVDRHSFRAEGGMFLCARFHHRYGLRLQFHYGTVTAADSVLAGKTGKALYRYQRNLHFRSRIFELSVQGMIAPLELLSPGRQHIWSPFVAAGAGLFHFDPNAMLGGAWVPLAPLRTEGLEPGTYYNRWQLHFPVSLGLRYEAGALFSCYAEMEYRFLRTDYLDDVSRKFIDPGQAVRSPPALKALEELYRLSSLRQGPPVSLPGSIRGNPDKNDSFFTLRIGAAVALNRQRIR